jgi:hypothetical protein
MVFATPFRQFYHYGTNSARLLGQSRLDNFIMTRKLSSIYQDYAKTHANPDIDGNCPYHRAVSSNNLDNNEIEILTYQFAPTLLAYGNSRFCIFKFKKPAHEHHLQAPTSSQT